MSVLLCSYLVFSPFSTSYRLLFVSHRLVTHLSLSFSCSIDSGRTRRPFDGHKSSGSSQPRELLSGSCNDCPSLISPRTEYGKWLSIKWLNEERLMKVVKHYSWLCNRSPSFSSLCWNDTVVSFYHPFMLSKMFIHVLKLFSISEWVKWAPISSSDSRILATETEMLISTIRMTPEIPSKLSNIWTKQVMKFNFWCLSD